MGRIGTFLKIDKFTGQKSIETGDVIGPMDGPMYVIECHVDKRKVIIPKYYYCSGTGRSEEEYFKIFDKQKEEYDRL